MRDSNNSYGLFDIVTESEPEFTDEKIVPAGKNVQWVAPHCIYFRSNRSLLQNRRI